MKIEDHATLHGAKLIIVKGLVQGIGFRPFVYKLAQKYGLSGWVENRTDSVWIKIQGRHQALEYFISTLQSEAPDLAKIESYIISNADYETNLIAFSIYPSKNLSNEVTEISPDIAVCDQCLEDMNLQLHRLHYPFINCTHCGPRFSIVQGLPYDRDQTTMHEFSMCNTCRKEYGDIHDRRFHAQPIACNNCGPGYTLSWNGTPFAGIREILQKVTTLLMQGKVIAVKGIGGFHLVCNALDTQAVLLLRTRKKRDGKPFAVMFPTIAKIKEYAEISPLEKEILLSRARPIVLLHMKKQLVPAINHGLHTLGALLPYMPLHHMIFRETGFDALVFTSGNIADEPIVKENDKAFEVFADIADAIVTHNRAIANREDDSVVRVAENSVLLLRRSRGYAPESLSLTFSADGILAVGAELKNCFCFGKGNAAIMSQHIGDLKSSDTFEFYSEAIDRFKQLFRFEPEMMVCDMHPDYLSSHYAKESGLPIIEVQHHHSHITACMAEHGIDHGVIGVSFDGTGLGDDGTIWGAEFFVCDLTSYRRLIYFQPVPMPGGDKATLEPWRMALSFLYKIYGRDCLEMGLPFNTLIDGEKQRFVLEMLEKNIHVTPTSSAGRLFDAVSALLGICFFNSFEAEAALKLEACIDETIRDRYPYTIDKTIHTLNMIQAIIDDLKMKRAISEISAKFHNTIIDMIVEAVDCLQKQSGLKTTVLSGGSFQNNYLFTHTVRSLQKKGLEVLWNKKVPCNDGGIALGQLAIAAKRR